MAYRDRHRLVATLLALGFTRGETADVVGYSPSHVSRVSSMTRTRADIAFTFALLASDHLPGANDQVEYFTELATFGMFPLDVIVVSHVPHVAERVRVAMRAHLLSGVNKMRRGARLAPLSQGDWEQRVDERFARYAVALEIPNQTTGLPPYFAFAKEVSTALGARDNMAVHGHVAITFAMLMKHMPASVTALLED